MPESNDKYPIRYIDNQIKNKIWEAKMNYQSKIDFFSSKIIWKLGMGLK